ncbi:MAG: hydantoinase/oxoprolinase family protein, partial [bacterium]
MYSVGVDIGGTFTDVVILDEEGALRTYKTSSTPPDLGRGVLDGLLLAASDLGLPLERLLAQTAYFGHGTTAATNAFIERKGSKTGLITTRGFRDTLLIQRMLGMTAGLHEEQMSHYSLRAYPDPIVPPELIFEVTERVDYKGAEIVRLREDDVRRAAGAFREAGVEAVAVCLLWSFKNPAHEQRIREILQAEAPEIEVSLSSDVIPVIREYERTATTAINAYLRSRITAYIGGLQKDLQGQGLKGPFLILNSIGGVVTADEAPAKAVTLLTSGPTGGVIGSLSLGKVLGHTHIITTDMGGTSFDAGVIVEGNPLLSGITTVEKYHILTPMIGIDTIGAGGGSIA